MKTLFLALLFPFACSAEIILVNQTAQPLVVLAGPRVYFNEAGALQWPGGYSKYAIPAWTTYRIPLSRDLEINSRGWQWFNPATFEYGPSFYTPTKPAGATDLEIFMDTVSMSGGWVTVPATTVSTTGESGESGGSSGGFVLDDAQFYAGLAAGLIMFGGWWVWSFTQRKFSEAVD